MKKILAFAAASLAAGSLSMAAHAAPVDFVSFAAGNEHGIVSGTVGTSNVTINGVDMTLLSNFNPYFDDVDAVSRKPGGLGVCRNLATLGVKPNQCNPGSDDSIDGDGGTAEYIKILFTNGPVDIRHLSFNNGQHNSLNTDNVAQVTYMVLNAAGVATFTATTSFANLVALASGGAFLNVAGLGFQFAGTEFYVDTVSDVPLPAALPLLLSGLAGLGFAARRKKAA